jgi:hypothetical protein
LPVAKRRRSFSSRFFWRSSSLALFAPLEALLFFANDPLFLHGNDLKYSPCNGQDRPKKKRGGFKEPSL